ncbi:MAG: hypothetical protein ACI97A_002815 [Planctomycetota bacterium]|jgi:hypothetical protein
MSISLLADSDLECWVVWLDRIKQRLDLVLNKLGEEESDWAPDIGVASPKDHLWAIAESERNLASLIARGKRSSKNHDAAEIEFDEIKRMLRIFDGNLRKELAKLANQEIGSEIRLAMMLHLDIKSHHTAAIASLTQLIDPSRLPELLL